MRSILLAIQILLFSLVHCKSADDKHIQRPTKRPSQSVRIWPLKGDLVDIKEGLSLTISGLNCSVSATNDFSERPNNAISISNCFIDLPISDLADGGDFTFSLFAKVDNNTDYNSDPWGITILDCASGTGNNDNIIFQYQLPSQKPNSVSTAQLLSLQIYRDDFLSTWFGYNYNYEYQKWNHYAITLKRIPGRDVTIGTIFLNGKFVVKGTFNFPIQASRHYCYIGKSIHNSLPDSVSGSFSDIIVYNRALSQSEIAKLAKSLASPNATAAIDQK